MQTERIKSAQVQKIFGGCAKVTVYRMWKQYGILPPPTVIRGINYWTLAEVEQAFQNSQKAPVATVQTPAPKTADTERAAVARQGKKMKTIPATGDR